MDAFRVEELVGGGQQPLPRRLPLKSLGGHVLILLTGLSTDAFEQHLGGGSAAVDGDGCTRDVARLWRGKVRSGAAPLVYTGPGATAFTRTPLGLNSAAQARANAAWAALVAP